MLVARSWSSEWKHSERKHKEYDMSLDGRLGALKERHADLELRIVEEDHRPRPDSDALLRLKLEKLRLKEEIERLRKDTLD